MSLNNYMKLNTSAPVIIQTLSPRELNKLYKSYLKRIIFPSGNKNLKASYSNKINKHNNNSQKFKRDKLTAYTCHFNDRTTEFRCKRCIGRTEYQNNNRYASIIVPRARNTNFSGQVNISQLKENMRRAQITGSAQFGFISMELASVKPITFLECSITAICIPKHIPKNGILFSLA